MEEDAPTIRLPELYTKELALGATLNGGKFTIQKKLGAGGFGITYLAQDHLGRDVALKECFPLGVVARAPGGRLEPVDEDAAKTFATGKALFLREARILASLSHPNIVRVQTHFEDNNTAYMAMDFVGGQNLEEATGENTDMSTPDSVLDLARVLLDALVHLHDERLIHRDIKPSNIILQETSGKPVLIDFGASRPQARTQSQNLQSYRLVSDGYSPSEFYSASDERLRPASDLYSLAATLYHIITRDVPPTAIDRTRCVANGQGDPYQKLVGRFPQYDQDLLTFVDQSMALNVEQRPQNGRAWLERLEPEVETPPPPPPPERRASPMLTMTWLLVGCALGALSVYALTQNEMGSLGAQITQLEADVAQTSEQLDAEREDVATLEMRLSDMETESGQTIEDLSAELELARGRVLGLESDLGTSQDALSALEEQRDQSVEQLTAEFRAERDQALQEAEQFRTDRDQSRETADNLSRQLASAEEELNALQSQLATSQAEFDQAMESVAQSEGMIDTLQGQTVRNQTALAEAESARDAALESLRDAEQTILDLLVQLSDSQQSAEAAPSTADAVPPSTDSAPFGGIFANEYNGRVVATGATGCPGSLRSANGVNYVHRDSLVLNGPQEFTTNATGSISLQDCFDRSAAGLTDDLVGFVQAAPAFSLLLLDLNGNPGELSLRSFTFEVASSCDALLLVRTPSGFWFYDNDDLNFDPRLEIRSESFRVYGGIEEIVDIWVGSFDNDFSCTARLTVSAS